MSPTAHGATIWKILWGDPNDPPPRPFGKFVKVNSLVVRGLMYNKNNKGPKVVPGELHNLRHAY